MKFKGKIETTYLSTVKKLWLIKRNILKIKIKLRNQRLKCVPYWNLDKIE